MGGSSLDLTTVTANVEEELGLEEGSITGSWDFAHNLQIIWKNTLAQHQTVEEIIQLVFQTMDNFRTGKANSVFRERASHLGHLVLSNKKRQTTRFVRSLVRGVMIEDTLSMSKDFIPSKTDRKN